MRVLILGGNGMLGHQLLLYLRKHHDVRVTLRDHPDIYTAYNLFHAKNSYFNINLLKESDLSLVITDFKPEAIINASGIIKQRIVKNEAMTHIEMNALFPHRLAKLCHIFNIRLIHISTDCVFSGEKGQYKEEELSDAKDIYGKTKYLGEVTTGKAITLRTSLIGLELSRKISLIEWYLQTKGNIKGFDKVFFSGFTTYEIGKIINILLTTHSHLSGLWHVGSQPISKYHLLYKLTNALRRNDIYLEKDSNIICDRTLISDKFCAATNYKIPTWDELINQLIIQINQRRFIKAYYA